MDNGRGEGGNGAGRVSRRTLLAAGGAAAGTVTGLALGPASPARAGGRAAAAPATAAQAVTAAEGAAAAALRPDVGVSAFPFPLSAVSLLDSRFRQNMTRTTSYLSFVDLDRMLHTFRVNVGLPSSAAPLGGWETPTTELRGHSTGHLMTALAQAYASTGSATYKSRGDYLVAELARCQNAAPSAGYRSGYLSAYPESFIDRVEARRSVWAPYYTLHKIMAGLLDQYLLAGNAQALDVVTRMAGWVKGRLDRLTTSQVQNMLDTEFGGMNEVLTNLYQVTANPDHLAQARRFDHAEIFDPLAANQDRLAGYHANTQIPKALGAVREYMQTGDARYLTIASNFWDIVVRSHTYVLGGNSNGEYFQTPNAIASQLSDSTAETCNSYNMLKLTRQLFFLRPDQARYMDYYERTLYNQILGQQDPRSGHGFVAYYIPLRAGGIKTYSNDYNNFTCDHGTGMESNTKYADSIYFSNGSTLYVNLFIPSVLTWSAMGMTVRQETAFPAQQGTRLTITGSGAMTLKVRIPYWTQPGAQLRVNGAAQPVPLTPGSYATLARTWASGDVVELTLPMALYREAAPDNPAVQAVKYGPVLLAGEYGSRNLSGLPSLNPATITPTSTPLRFTATASGSTVALSPFYDLHGQRYSVYWTAGTPA